MEDTIETNTFSLNSMSDWASWVGLSGGIRMAELFSTKMEQLAAQRRPIGIMIVTLFSVGSGQQIKDCNPLFGGPN